MESNPLPLFPLPVVLFPGIIIPLHIFEARYRQMVSDVLEGDGRFGLIYHDPDLTGPFMNEPGRVGTVAEIRKHQLLPDGRSLILVKGRGRFSIVGEVTEERPYYQAMVARYRDQGRRSGESMRARRQSSVQLFSELLKTGPHPTDALPPLDPEGDVSFKLAAAARMDVAIQQVLLEMRSEEGRLEILDPIFRYGITRSAGDGGIEA